MFRSKLRFAFLLAINIILTFSIFIVPPWMHIHDMHTHACKSTYQKGIGYTLFFKEYVVLSMLKAMLFIDTLFIDTYSHLSTLFVHAHNHIHQPHLALCV